MDDVNKKKLMPLLTTIANVTKDLLVTHLPEAQFAPIAYKAQIRDN
jgi:hypothetical protein